MIDYNALVIANNYQSSSEDFTKLILRMDKDITDYEAKENHSEKALAIRKEQISRMVHFLNDAETLIQFQKDMLHKYATLSARYKELENNYYVVKQYGYQLASEKGISNSQYEDVLRYNKPKHFNL